MQTDAQPLSRPPLISAPVVCTSERRLDPDLLARAVGLLVRDRPELGNPERRRPDPGTGQFVHLDLSTSRTDEHRGVEEIVDWMLGRCVTRSAGSPFLVIYLDPGADRPGRLVLAGRSSAVSDGRSCAALSEALLGLYGELTIARRARI